MYKASKRNPDDCNLKRKFLSYRNKLNLLLKSAKSNYYKNKILENSNNNKNVWDIVKEITNSKKCTEIIKEIEINDGTTTDENSEMANAFVKYFTNVGADLASRIKNKNYQPRRSINEQSLFLTPTDAKEISELITELKCNKSPGFDKITNLQRNQKSCL
ncbi:hypothetical protein JTB14_017456 [Gonioctena quinquepunctata]|nr:hypothetical protein JTB14_017456 [Gonioctena quinquepunctata]